MARKKPVEVILVAKDLSLEPDGQAFASATAVNLSDGQIGIYEAAPGGVVNMNVSVDSSNVATPSDAPKVYFAQGTAYSATPSTANGPSQPVSVASLAIPSSGVKSITWKEASVGKNCAWVIGDDLGGAGEINTEDLTDYSFDVSFRSRIKDRNFTMSSLEVVQVHFSTPDYTALATVDPLDDLVQNLVYQANTFSKAIVTNGVKGNKDFVAFAVNVSGGAGVSLTTLSTAGATITGYGIVTTAAQSAAFADIVTNTATTGLTGASTVEPIDLTTAGAAANCEAIIVMSLDRDIAVGYDRIADVRTRIQVGLIDGFNYPTVTNVEGSQAQEAEGTARKWRIFYEDTMGQRFYGKNKTLFPFAYQYPDFIVDSKTYDAMVLEYEDIPYTLDSSLTTDPHKLIILVPSDATGTLKADLEAFFQAWCPQVSIPTFS